MKNILVITFCICLLATTAISQSVASSTKSLESTRRIAELYFANSSKVVTDQPFSAEAISESVRVLADGNRITKSSSVKMFRDSDGRYRREPVIKKNGNGTSSSRLGITSIFSFRRNITILDPVESVRYILNSSKKTARKYNIAKRKAKFAKALKEKALVERLRKVEKDKSIKVEGTQYTLSPAQGVILSMTKNVKSESLGMKVFEGVETEGTKTTRTIAAGIIGNELPIEITYEKWYSKELDLILFSRKFDPRHGEQIYRLVNLDRNEPDISLFTVPDDYEIVEAKSLSFGRLKKDK